MLETIEKQEEFARQTKEVNVVLNHLSKPEVQEALTVLVTNLPKLAEMTTLLTKTYDLAKQAAGDRVLVQDTLGAIMEVMKPIEENVKHYASAAIEARGRAEKDDSTIGLFGMLGLLKDPEFQRVLRFGQAYLNILGDRRKQE
ncbi:DUF1641 domain-containing protein [Paenibacillus sp. CF384]|uniref:DUF1641 domain-containing protein n=1 Tax=Paenibacillus sp. CF384 TaxID=1884382 RepID=UPI0008966D00|nr:DUF1641 domain-containing protein [Paenibacillus sp. CF384]SDW47651.1 Uncharacterized conserved protein YjgD, DUF1641 family [Paenibacillus sp. CF384]